MVGAMMVDLSGAYDMVQIQTLGMKLELLGLDQEALNWILSFGQVRKQSVSIDGKLSSPLDLEFGLPQG